MGFDRLLVLVLIGGFVFSSGCRSKNSSGSTADSKLAAASHPELSMDQLKVQSYGPMGLDWEMTAPKADGYTANNKLHAENLKITFFQNGKKATDVTANEGILRFESKSEMPVAAVAAGSAAAPVPQLGPMDPGDMYLSGHVVAISTDGSRLTTDWLLFDKSRDVIFSTAPVQIVREDSITKGVGMEATSNLSKVKIFKQTLTIKEKPKKKKK